MKLQHLLVPRQAEKADDPSAFRRLILDDILVIDLEQNIGWQRRLPMRGQTAKGQIVVRQFDLVVGERELALKVSFVDRPARIQGMAAEEDDPCTARRRG